MCKEKLIEEHSDDTSHCQAVVIFIWILNFIVFIPLMFLASLILLIKIHHTSLRSYSSKLYIIIMSTVTIFLMFAMSMRILYLLNCYYRLSLLSQLHLVTLFLCTLNRSINPHPPPIYFFGGSSKKKQFKQTLKMVLNRAFTDGMQTRSQKSCPCFRYGWNSSLKFWSETLGTNNSTLKMQWFTASLYNLCENKYHSALKQNRWWDNITFTFIGWVLKK